MTTEQSRRSVTIVITTYNHARFLGEAIASAIRQEHPADNIIVVDDGSTDGTAEVVTQFKGVDYVRQENKGLSSARNTGLAKCTTDYVTFLDADDRLLPCAVAAGLSMLSCKSGMRPDIWWPPSDLGKRVANRWRSSSTDHRGRACCFLAGQYHRHAWHGALSARCLARHWGIR